MQSRYAKVYLYILIVISAINLVLGIIYEATKNAIFETPLLFFAFAEMLVFILSVIMIIIVFTRKLNRINLVLPVFYLFIFLSIITYEIVTGSETSRQVVFAGFDMYYILFSIESLAYLFKIGFGIYLLRKEQFFLQGK